MRATLGTAVTHDDTSSSRTVLVLLCAFTTLFWSIFTPPHRTFAARVVLFQPLWIVRMWVRDSGWINDLALSLLLHAVYGYWSGMWRLFTPDDFRKLDWNSGKPQLNIQIFALLGVCGALAGGIVHRGQQLKPVEQNGHLRERAIDEQLLPPLLITSRTTHSRIFPQRHAFSYSYLFVGIPVGIRGRISTALSVDSQKPSWFDVSSADYLTRETGDSGLAEKLKRYLHAQGVTDRDYSFAYLVTAPRFLGYSFNPVSFWYLYDSETTLKYMILEVNNTFDERRIYLLRASNGEQHSDEGASELSDGEDGKRVNKMMFTETWDKDFHVSPFNSRKGSYSLRAIDPLSAYEESGRVKIDNTIVLRSSKESAKVVARVRSEGPPRDATQISPWQLTQFIASWWYVGILTFPRIVWEAQKLFFRKKLHVWYRPEVTGTSIGRKYTDDEKHLERYFRDFLEEAMSYANRPLRLIYEPAQPMGEEMVMYSPGFTFEEDHQRTITLQVTSPAFYSRFVHYAHAKEAFDRECLATDEKNRTLVIKTANLLPILLDAMKALRRHGSIRQQGTLEKIRWNSLRHLRCPPPDASYPQPTEYEISDIRSFGDSELDLFVKERSEDAATYRRIVSKLFLATRLALGTPLLISTVDWILRAGVLLACMYYCDHSRYVDVLRPRRFDIEDVPTVVATALLANSVHIWSLIKG